MGWTCFDPSAAVCARSDISELFDRLRLITFDPDQKGKKGKVLLCRDGEPNGLCFISGLIIIR